MLIDEMAATITEASTRPHRQSMLVTADDGVCGPVSPVAIDRAENVEYPPAD